MIASFVRRPVSDASPALGWLTRPLAGIVSLLCLCYSNAQPVSNTNLPSQGWLLVANKGNQTLSIIDPATGATEASIAEAAITGHEVAASPDGKFAYVPIYGNAGVGRPGTDGQLLLVIDLHTRTVVSTVDFGRGVRPHCVVVGPKDGLLYITTELDNSVTVIDPAKLKILGTIPTGQTESHMLAIATDGRKGYTANVSSGTVSVLDLEARRLLATIPVAAKVQRIALSADDRWVFTADQTKPRLAIIDTRTNGVARWIELPGTGYGTACTPDGKWLLAALNKINEVAVIDLKAWKLVRTLEVPKSPQEILVRPDGAEAFVSCDASQTVVVIDLNNWAIARQIKSGPGTDGLAWARRN